MAGSKRKLLECRMQGCTLNVSGSEKEVVETGVQHAVSAHSQKDTPQLRDQIRSMLKDEQ
ncbi:MAG TPA: DUF1059 domain-containing protein [Acidobacteriota bacterium]|nr:DUF1059 domain-containing protein [Acidobacteriota bacterium]